MWRRAVCALLELGDRGLSLGRSRAVRSLRCWAPGAIEFGVRLRPGSSLVQTVRCYASASRKSQELPSQLDDLAPTMLQKDYRDVELVNKTDDVVRRLLSLEMASHREKVKLKTSQLVEKVRRSPSDIGSTEVQIAILTAKIRNYQEHLQLHRKFRELSALPVSGVRPVHGEVIKPCSMGISRQPAAPDLADNSLLLSEALKQFERSYHLLHSDYGNNDKTNKRHMLLAIDRRKKLLKYLRRTRYEVFENVCTQLGIQYTFPPEYYRRVTQRWAAKKALCIRVFQEVQKLRAAERQKQKAAAAEKAQSVSKQVNEGTPV